MRLPTTLTALVAATLFAAGPLAHAAAITVDTLDDESNVDGDCSLREAIEAANTNAVVDNCTGGDAGLDLIDFLGSLNGTITLTLGELLITESVDIDGTGASVTVSGNFSARIFRFTAGMSSVNALSLTRGFATRGGAVFVEPGVDVTLNDLSVFDNIGTGPSANAGGGGAFNDNGTLTINGGSFFDNDATGTSGSGGAVHNSEGTLTVSWTTFLNNTSRRAGGAIENDGGTVSLIDVILDDNEVGNIGNGGGLHSDGGDVAVSGGAAIDNRARMGGGFWSSGTFTLDGTLVFNNTASASPRGGGGLFNEGGTMTISNATITSNEAIGASGSGGGILNNSGGTLTVSSSVLGGNAAHRGGGGIEDAGGFVVLTDVTLDGNNAGGIGDGGGIHTDGGDVTVTGGSVVNNNAEEGGGMWSSGTLTVDGTVIDNNTADDDGGGGLFNEGGTMSVINATITNNQATGTSGSGGGILNNSGGTLTVTGSVIAFNSAQRAGGGIEDAGSTTVLTDVTLDSNDSGTNPGSGGGLHTGGGDVTVTGGSVINNTSVEGGGLWSSGTLSVDGTLIDNNSGSGDDTSMGGGGLFNSGGTMIVSNATISNNDATGLSGSGGGILNDEGGDLTVSLTTLVGNSSVRAGGAIEDNEGAGVSLFGVIMDGNSAGDNPGNGGALHITGAGTVAIDSSQAINNVAAHAGGGLWISTRGNLTVTRTRVHNNTAPTGGGVFQDGMDGVTFVDQSNVTQNAATITNGGGIVVEGGTFDLLNTTVSENSAAVDGGGFSVLDGTITLANVTVASNTAVDDGGGLYIIGGTVSIDNALLGDNVAANGPECAGTLDSNDFNLIEDASGCTITGDTANNITGLDPMLGPLADSGGPTLTQALLDGSPAIDAGDCTLLEDQRTYNRPAVPPCDMGAYEFEAPVPVELISFDVLLDGDSAMLNWATSSETNNAGFEVQLLASGQEDFQVLAVVEGHGTTTEEQSYSYVADNLGYGTHVFRLRQIDFDGAFEYSPDVEVFVGLAKTFILEPAYPNPFNPQATVRFVVRESQLVQVALYDIAGRLVQILYDGAPPAGEVVAVQLEGSALASGVYFVRITGENILGVQMVTLLK